MFEYRSGCGYDNGVADHGIVAWHCREDSRGGPFIGEGAESPAHSIYVVSPGAPRGGSRAWKPSDGPFRLHWADGSPLPCSYRVETISPGGRRGPAMDEHSGGAMSLDGLATRTVIANEIFHGQDVFLVTSPGAGELGDDGRALVVCRRGSAGAADLRHRHLRRLRRRAGPGDDPLARVARRSAGSWPSRSALIMSWLPRSLTQSIRSTGAARSLSAWSAREASSSGAQFLSLAVEKDKDTGRFRYPHALASGRSAKARQLCSAQPSRLNPITRS